MFSELNNPELLKAQVSKRINEATGLNNTSKSSILTHITDAIANTVHDTSSYTASVINSTFTEFASGDRLTDNAIEFGVIRNIYADMYISGEDGIVSLNTSDGMNFPRYANGKRVIAAGSRYTIGSTTVEVLNDVYVSSSESSIPLNVRLISQSSTDIKTGSYIDITNPKDINTASLRIVFNSPVYNRLYEEDDDALKSRILDSKMKVHGSSVNAIAGIIKSIPLVRSYYIDEDIGGCVSSIYIATDATFEGKEELSIQEIRSRAVSKLDSLISAHQSFNIDEAGILYIYPIYTYKNTTESMAIAAIKESFDVVYKPFSTSIDIDSIKEGLATYGLEIEIDNIALKSKDYGTILMKSGGQISFPSAHILSFSAIDSIGVQE